MTTEEYPDHSSHKVLIQELKVLLAATGCLLKHTFCEGNQVADRLANMGVNQEDEMMLHVILLDDIIPLLEADMGHGF
ncbi:hypothetical protein RHMOL_Rhmol13G0014400 [Rhododendron molle]|uniref:Uncharacterized protein n=1 Tax=Rhododendron molle TaxID=49168 RepID=A0ACC0L1V1_RHOML|nr:hypothetical protein RHMOL_Rhmol13G0014400 [Rhododendron molle]